MLKLRLIISVALFQYNVCPFSALNNTMMKLSNTGQTLEDYNYQNEGIADIILNEIADLQFKGMSVSPFIINFRNVRYRMSLIMGFYLLAKKTEYFIIYGFSIHVDFS